MIVFSVLTFVAFRAGPVTMTLVPTGASKKAGLVLAAADLSSSTMAKIPAGLDTPQYGTIIAGTKKYAFVADLKGKLIVDVNGNGDFSDDPELAFTGLPSAPTSMATATTTVDMGKKSLVGLKFLRVAPKGTSWPTDKDKLLYALDYGYDVSFSLDGESFTTFIAGEPTDKTRISIDRNHDGKIQVGKETVMVGVPFNFTGTTYQFDLGSGRLALNKSPKPVAMTPMPAIFALGTKAIPILAKATDGSTVDLLKDYKGKIVMLDFWATWCGPCRAELPNVKAAYLKYHDQGFEVLGISFDQANMAEKLKTFTEQNGMPWKQIYEGKFWDTSIGRDYEVRGIPFTLLIDGDSGKILGDAGKLRGPGITAFIGEQLQKKKAAG